MKLNVSRPGCSIYTKIDVMVSKVPDLAGIGRVAGVVAAVLNPAGDSEIFSASSSAADEGVPLLVVAQIDEVFASRVQKY